MPRTTEGRGGPSDPLEGLSPLADLNTEKSNVGSETRVDDPTLLPRIMELHERMVEKREFLYSLLTSEERLIAQEVQQRLTQMTLEQRTTFKVNPPMDPP